MSSGKHRPGRKKRNCKINYNNAKRWLSNKVRKLTTYVRHNPNDLQAVSALQKAKTKLT